MEMGAIHWGSIIYSLIIVALIVLFIVFLVFLVTFISRKISSTKQNVSQLEEINRKLDRLIELQEQENKRENPSK